VGVIRELFSLKGTLFLNSIAVAKIRGPARGESPGLEPSRTIRLALKSQDRGILSQSQGGGHRLIEKAFYKDLVAPHDLARNTNAHVRKRN